MKRWQSLNDVVVTDAEQTFADLRGAVSPAGYVRFFVPKPGPLTVKATVAGKTVTVFDGDIGPKPGKAAVFEIRIRRHPDVDAAPLEPKPAQATDV